MDIRTDCGGRHGTLTTPYRDVRNGVIFREHGRERLLIEFIASRSAVSEPDGRLWTA